MKHIGALLDYYNEHHKGVAKIIEAAVRASNSPEFIRGIATALMQAADADVKRDAEIIATLTKGLKVRIPPEAYEGGRPGRTVAGRGRRVNYRPAIAASLQGLGIDADVDDCDVCEDGSVWYGFVQILPKGAVPKGATI